MIRNKPSIDYRIKKNIANKPQKLYVWLAKNKRKNQDEVHLFSIKPYAEWKTGFSN